MDQANYFRVCYLASNMELGISGGAYGSFPTTKGSVGSLGPVIAPFYTLYSAPGVWGGYGTHYPSKEPKVDGMKGPAGLLEGFVSSLWLQRKRLALRFRTSFFSYESKIQERLFSPMVMVRWHGCQW